MAEGTANAADPSSSSQGASKGLTQLLCQQTKEMLEYLRAINTPGSMHPCSALAHMLIESWRNQADYSLADLEHVTDLTGLKVLFYLSSVDTWDFCLLP